MTELDVDGQPKLIILDKSFLQAESRSGKRLRALHESGCTFVLTDTLVYESCTGSRQSLWVETLRKLFPFAGSVQVWLHTGELLKRELETKHQIESPFSEDLTNRTQVALAQRNERLPADLAAISSRAFQQREVDSVAGLISLCRTLSEMTAPVGETLRRKIAQREDVSPHCNAIVNDQRIVDRLISWAHGNPDNADIYLPLAQQGLDPGWFTLHHTRSTLALLCVFLTKYTERDTPGKEFRNTKLDADYLALLHYADGLATNETSGIMADMCSWLYGDTKTVFATAQLDEVLPSEDETRLAAYLDWRGGGMKNGRDVEDWLGAEKRLLADVWNRLRGQRES